MDHTLKLEFNQLEMLLLKFYYFYVEIILFINIDIKKTSSHT